MNKLPNAPLQEVIFEARWELRPDAAGNRLIDPAYQFALGKFQNLVKGGFPVTVSKFPQELPHQLLAYQTMHQFWKGEREWPVLQLGPGIITVNDTEKNYEWVGNYLPLVQQSIEHLLSAYEKLTFTECALRYIDVVKVSDYGFSTWEAFVREHVNFSFANNFDTRGPLVNFQFEQAFEVNETGTLAVNMSNGQNNKREPLFIWQTAITQKKKLDKTALLQWLDKAHGCTSSIFKEICKNEFYGSFSK